MPAWELAAADGLHIVSWQIDMNLPEAFIIQEVKF